MSLYRIMLRDMEKVHKVRKIEVYQSFLTLYEQKLQVSRFMRNRNIRIFIVKSHVIM